MKFLIWAVIVFLVMAWIMRSKNAASQAGASQPGSPAPGRSKQPEAMLQCDRCGLHVPASEAVRHAPGAVFCSEEHRRQTFPDA
jgi:uncharacterized protein